MSNTRKQDLRCPDCRNNAIRRRRRSKLSLYIASLFGYWPYKCDECGSRFLLSERYLPGQSYGYRREA